MIDCFQHLEVKIFQLVALDLEMLLLWKYAIFYPICGFFLHRIKQSYIRRNKPD
jgi:hypothetical protein